MSTEKQIAQVEDALNPGWTTFTQLSPENGENGDGGLRRRGSPGDVEVPPGYEVDEVVFHRDDDQWVMLRTGTGTYRVAPGFFGAHTPPEARSELEETRLYLERELGYTEDCR